jgi:sulfate adenylyltransferase subunit 1 (EFTu-like GTPase family)
MKTIEEIKECTCQRPDDNTCEYCEKQEYQIILADAKNKYMEETFYKSQLLINNILGFKPMIGHYVKVEGIDISEKFFKEEFEQITKAYFSVIEKIRKYK